MNDIECINLVKRQCAKHGVNVRIVDYFGDIYLILEANYIKWLRISPPIDKYELIRFVNDSIRLVKYSKSARW